MRNEAFVSLPADVNPNGSKAATLDTKQLADAPPTLNRLGNTGKAPAPSPTAKAEDHFVYNTDEDGYYYWHGDHWSGIDKSTAYENLKHGFGIVDAEDDLAAGRFLYQIRAKKQVKLAVKLAGYSAGMHPDSRKKPFLVVESTEPMTGTPGEWPLIKRIVTNMLREQTKYFHSWMKLGLEALRDKTGAPGHYLIIMGDHNTGKTLLQERIISPLLDCLPTNCVEYLTGKTEFNSDLFRSFHLMISDGLTLSNYAEKQVYTERVKGLLANTVQRLRGMYRNAVHVPYNCRLSCSLNLPAINSLPLIEDGMSDKMLLLKATPHRYIVSPQYPRPKFEAQIAAELPHYAYWLLNVWEIPTALKKNLMDDRFGFAAYLNPEILEHRAEESREVSLAGILREYIGQRGGKWSSTPDKLYGTLSKEFGKRFDNLCANSRSLGQLLSDLAKGNVPGVAVRKRKSNGDRVVDITVDVAEAANVPIPSASPALAKLASKPGRRPSSLDPARPC